MSEEEELKIELKQIVRGHEGEVNSCDFGPRDRILATASRYINVTSFSSIPYCSNSEYWS